MREILRDFTTIGQTLLLSIPKHKIRVESVLRNAALVATHFASIHFGLSVSAPRAYNHPLTLVDSFYFSAVTLATVGYGDIYPVSDMAKILCIAEIGSGIVVLVLSSGILISLWMQTGTEQRE